MQAMQRYPGLAWRLDEIFLIGEKIAYSVIFSKPIHRLVDKKDEFSDS